MQYSECQSTHIRKNGKKKGKQNHTAIIGNARRIDRLEQQAS